MTKIATGFKIVKANKEMGYTQCPVCAKNVRYFVVGEGVHYCQECYDKLYKSLNGFAVKDYKFEELVLMQEGMEELAQFAKHKNLMYHDSVDKFYYFLEMMGGVSLLGVYFTTISAGHMMIEFKKTRQFVLPVRSKETANVLHKLFMYNM